MTMPLCGTGGSGTLTAGTGATDERIIFDASQNGGGTAAYEVANNEASGGNSCKIRVVGLHIDQTSAGGTDGMAILKAGESKVFADAGHIRLIRGYGVGGNVSITGTLRAR